MDLDVLWQASADMRDGVAIADNGIAAAPT
jgi:hypothetical protein